jgi:23S rRNA pseudouridine2605 synthase
MSPQPHRGRTGKPGPAKKAGGRPAGKRGGPGGPVSGGRGSDRAAAKSVAKKVAVKDVHDPDGIRLQKVLAQAGVGSRRACEELIANGRVMVDDQVVRELGVRVDPSRVVIHVDGLRVQLDESKVYLAINKPPGVVSTMDDERGRPALSDFVGQRKERLFHVGRLDIDTEGLLLLTNDGELAHRLLHPSYGVQKVYLAEIRGPVARDVGKRLRAGVELEEGLVSVDSFKVVDSQPGKALVEVVLHEGKHHVVRRLLEAVGYPVLQLVRTDVGPIKLGELRSGKVRALTRDEVARLYDVVGL